VIFLPTVETKYVSNIKYSNLPITISAHTFADRLRVAERVLFFAIVPTCSRGDGFAASAVEIGAVIVVVNHSRGSHTTAVKYYQHHSTIHSSRKRNLI
jgi:UDP-N-acetylmuramyl tripeptide synthase